METRQPILNNQWAKEEISRMAKVRQVSADKYVEELEPSHAAGEDVKWRSRF